MRGEATATGTKRALLLIDFQRDFLRDDGRMPVDADQREPAVAAANCVAAVAKARGDAVIAIGDAFRRGEWTNLFRRFAAQAGSEGARSDERVAIDGAPCFAKWRGGARRSCARLSPNRAVRCGRRPQRRRAGAQVTQARRRDDRRDPRRWAFFRLGEVSSRYRLLVAKHAAAAATRAALSVAVAP